MAKAREDDRPTVAVVDAGIAGLTAALRLAERGYKVTVFEQYVHLGSKLRARRHRISSGLIAAYADGGRLHRGRRL